MRPELHDDRLSLLASEYTQGMTSIRGRRVQRLLKREFAGADHLLLARTGSGAPLVLGLSSSGAALCATDGKGRQAAVVKWLHESQEAFETQFDLYKDSLPALESHTVPMHRLRDQIRLNVTEVDIPPQAQPLLAKVCLALA